MRSWITLPALALGACAAETSSPAVADHFEVVQGGAQTGTPGWALDSQVVVRLIDDKGHPLPGVAVTWMVREGGGRLDSASTVTDDDGLATARWTLGPTATDQRIGVLAADIPVLEIPATTALFRASTIAVGDQAMCALDMEGLPWCWGSGEWPWDGTLASPMLSPFPTRLATDQAFVRLTGGNHHWCALTATGATWCWSGYYARSTGRSAAMTQMWIPAPIEGAPQFATINAGQDHTCGVEPSGQAWCWGQTEDDRGLGGFPSPYSWSLVRVPQAPTTAFVRTASGWAHNCGIDTGGEVWCWGYDNWGDLGDTLTGSRNVPTKVPLPAPAREVAVGDYHSCALLTTGPLYCWGLPIAGQPVSGTEADLARPRLTDPAPGAGLRSGWMMIHSIRSGRVIRVGSMVDISGLPLTDPLLSRADSHDPPIGITGMVEVSGQVDLACGRLLEGEVYCWGNVPGVGRTTAAVAVPAPLP